MIALRMMKVTKPPTLRSIHSCATCKFSKHTGDPDLICDKYKYNFIDPWLVCDDHVCSVCMDAPRASIKEPFCAECKERIKQ